MAIAGTYNEAERDLAPTLRENVQHESVLIHGAPEIMRLAGDLEDDLIEVPLPLAEAPHAADPLPAYVCCEQRAEPVPPIPHRLVADLDVPLVQQVLDVPVQHVAVAADDDFVAIGHEFILANS